MHLASYNGYEEIVKLLIKKRVDVNQVSEYGQNALFLASNQGHVEIVRLLIENGIYVNYIDPHTGQNALHFASINGSLEIVKLLIEKGIDINQKDFLEEKALDCAIKNNHRQIVKFINSLQNNTNLIPEDFSKWKKLKKDTNHVQIINV